MQSQGGNSPPGRSVKTEGSVGEQPLVTSPIGPRRIAVQQGNNGGGFMPQQQFGVQGSMEYPDAQTMDFLQNLGSSTNGEFANVDQSQVDLGFGINWEGIPNEYGDGPQMNPFDTFFFGGPPGSNGGGPGGGMGM
jgi:hypothetical protein